MRKGKIIWDIMIAIGMFGIPILAGGDPLTLGFWVREAFCFASLFIGARKGGYIYVE